MHTLNDQVFRGFFTGRYLFDSVTGFLRYASPAAAGGFGPSTVGCSNGSYVTAPTPCPAGSSATGGPLLPVPAGRRTIGTGDRRRRRVADRERRVRVVRAGPVADPSQPHAQLRPALGRAADAGNGRSADDRLCGGPERSGVSVGRHDSRSVGDDPAASRRHVGRAGRRPVGPARQRRRLLRAPEHAEPGGIGDDQRPPAADAVREHREHDDALAPPTPTWPGVLVPPAVPEGQFPLFLGVRVFDKDYKNPHVYAFNVGYEQALAADLAGYVDVTWTEGRDLTRFLNYNRSSGTCCDQGPGTGNTFVYTQRWAPQLDEVMVANSRGESRYRGLTLGIRKRFSDGLPVRGATTCWPRTRTTTPTSATRSPIAASTSSISTSTGDPRTATSGTR